MKFNLISIVLVLGVYVFNSCTNEANSDLNDENKDLIVDSTSLDDKDLDTSKNVSEIKEYKENLVKIEKKYGEQWGFCECVVANDSVNNAIIALTDFEGPKFDKLMVRSDFITKKCQAFLSMDGSKTPEDRMIHERKVKKCLKEAKK